MRETSYPGKTLGAIVIEKRRGCVSSVKIGTVDRNPPEGAMWIYKFTKTAEILGKNAKGIAETLSAARMSPDRLELYDLIIRECAA